MTDLTAEVCVVGAGPAGLTLALLLARSGVDVVLVERSRSFERQFRGEILQPGGMALLDRLGVLAGARERGSHEHDRFVLEERGRTLIDGDYRRLPGPFNCLLSIPQRHVLEELLLRCRESGGFRYLEGAKAGALLTEDGRVRGVVVGGRGGEQVVRARWTVGADGRYSKVRRLAGIEAGRLDDFDQDVLWFKLPADGRPLNEVRIFRAGGNPVLAYTAVPDAVQVGWTLPHGGYRTLAARGTEPVRELICAAMPMYAEQVRERITALGDLTLLDVFSGVAREWVRDGLVLIGDAAHTHSPIGAQGINLAVQDAVALHPALLASLAADGDSGPVHAYAAGRRRDIARIMRIQRLQSRGMLSSGRVAGALRPVLAPLLSRSPVYRRVLAELAFGNRAIAPAPTAAAPARSAVPGPSAAPAPTAVPGPSTVRTSETSEAQGQ
ncbi:FAD-dependent monooxygenase [Kitasatospora sp. NPDC093550]|uniref:FAD-dependent monooxygenase n=1 Tax=Kitasatospora sp. NPDC093550 TaxID=3364089 RepID=UPI00380FC2FB